MPAYKLHETLIMNMLACRCQQGAQAIMPMTASNIGL